MESIDALKTTQILQLPDYYEGPENKVPLGRQIMTQKPDGGYGLGVELVRQLKAWCAVPTSEGDFVTMAQAINAKLGNLNNAWRMQVVMEHTLDLPSVPKGIWQPPGDSMVIVNKYGERVVNEKHNYHDRAKVHFTWDANREEYSNEFLFMIYDRRVAELFADNFPLPAAGAQASYVIEADSLPSMRRSMRAGRSICATIWA